MESLFGTLDVTNLQVLANKNVKHKQPCEEFDRLKFGVKGGDMELGSSLSTRLNMSE